MIAIIAPARNLRPVEPALQPTRPLFGKQAMQLVQQLRQYSPWQLESLLDVPPQRALELYDAYQTFDWDKPGWPALLAYNGAAYRNMAPARFSTAQLAFAQQHLRIMSALYGMLRPLDGVLEHRLGLKKDFSPGGADLHSFWGDRLCQALYQHTNLVINLASVEYAQLITRHMRPGQRMITCRFLVEKPTGISATVSTVRAARGLMAGFIIEHQIDDPKALQDFDADGYRFVPARPGTAEYVFIRYRRLQ